MPFVTVEPKTVMTPMALVCGHGALRVCFGVVECDCFLAEKWAWILTNQRQQLKKENSCDAAVDVYYNGCTFQVEDIATKI